MSSILNIKSLFNKILLKIEEDDKYQSIVEEYLENLYLNMFDNNEKKSINEEMTHEKILELKGLIDILNKTQQVEVFKIIYASGKYTENSNGIFINLNNLSSDVLWKLNDLVKYYSNKNKYLVEEQEHREMILENVNVEKNDNNIRIKTVLDTSLDISEKELTLDNDLSEIENEILNEEFNIYNDLLLSNKKPLYDGIEARIVKKCKELNKTVESVSGLLE